MDEATTITSSALHSSKALAIMPFLLPFSVEGRRLRAIVRSAARPRSLLGPKRCPLDSFGRAACAPSEPHPAAADELGQTAEMAAPIDLGIGKTTLHRCPGQLSSVMSTAARLSLANCFVE